MNRNKSTIYISHRQADKAIADVLKNAMHSWCNGQIQVFQSSDVRNNASKVGQKLTDTHKKVLSDTNVMLLIYTVADNDWLYCIWECGLATNPSGQEPKIVVLQCASDVPATLQDQMRVVVDEESIKAFIHDFHKDPTFHPGRKEAFASELDEKTIEERSQNFFNQLSGVCFR
jgi:hypothetical protein